MLRQLALASMMLSLTGLSLAASSGATFSTDRQFPPAEASAFQCDTDSLQNAMSVSNAYLVDLYLTRAVELKVENLVPADLAIIPPDAAVLLYVPARTFSCVWLLDAGGVVAVETTASGEEVNRALGDMLKAFDGPVGLAKLDQPAARGMRPEVDPAVSALQTTELMRPATRLLLPGEVGARALAYDHIYVVPFGRIGTFPFAALPMDDGSLLIDHMSLAVAPGLGDLLASRVGAGSMVAGCDGRLIPPRRRAAITDALVVGDPDYSVGGTGLVKQLPGAEAEAREVAAMFGASPLIGRDATPAAVRARIKNADLVYFATHGVAFPDTGLDGYIALSGGQLTAKDVQETCLPKTQLVVLSACQTGLGEPMEGGVIGLSRAFQLGGAPHVAMSLWNVDDSATRFLGGRLMTHYSAGASATTALRNAMLDTRRSFPDPRHWASFMMFSAAMEGTNATDALQAMIDEIRAGSGRLAIELVDPASGSPLPASGGRAMAKHDQPVRVQVAVEGQVSGALLLVDRTERHADGSVWRLDGLLPADHPISLAAPVTLRGRLTVSTDAPVERGELVAIVLPAEIKFNHLVDVWRRGGVLSAAGATTFTEVEKTLALFRQQPELFAAAVLPYEIRR